MEDILPLTPELTKLKEVNNYYENLSPAENSQESLDTSRNGGVTCSHETKLELDTVGANERPSGRGNKRGRSSSNDSLSSDSDKHQRSATKLSSVLVRPSRGKADSDHEEERKKIIESQRSNKQVFNRNKRMFGMLVGTLKQFKMEETDREGQTSARRNRDVDLLTVIEDRTPLKKDTDEIRDESEEIYKPLDKAEIKAEITNQFTYWEITHRRLCNFIQTETKPKIFWLPKEHNPHTERRLRETRDYYSLYIAERAAKLKKELAELDETEELVTR